MIEQKKFLENAIKNNKLPQVVIFEGRDTGILKETTLWFAKHLNKGFENYKQDVIFLENNGEEIKIEIIKNLQEALVFKKQFSLFRVIILEGAQNLNQEAQSRLLKTLEEPQANTIFILLTNSADLLLKTIVSRTWVLRFPAKQKELESEEANIFLSSNLAFKFEAINKLLKEGSGKTALLFLENIVCVLRKEMADNFAIKDKVALIENTRQMLLTSNLNTKLAMENIALNL